MPTSKKAAPLPWQRKPLKSIRRAGTCSVCNNLSAKGRTNSFYEEEEKCTKASATIEVESNKLRRSSESGCRYCTLLSQSLDAFWKEWRSKSGLVTIELRDDAPIKLSISSESPKSDCLELYTVPGMKLIKYTVQCVHILLCGLRLTLIGVRIQRTSLGSTHSISCHSASDDSFDFVSKCIEHCLSSKVHSRCIQDDNRKPPTRLLDLSQKESAIKLCSVNTKGVRYAALSHCWGNGPLLTTTTGTLENRKKGISFEDLPELFQDAVTIASRLSIRYLWIDALCIIQDDRADWDAEAARMGSIYENAFLAIAAVAARNSGQRCLDSRPKPTRVMYTDTKSKATPIKVRKVVNHHSDPDEAKPMNLLGPLTGRAWALQEHVLCTRVLHFTASEIIFECRTSSRCECRTSAKKGATTPGLIPKLLSGKADAKIYAGWHDLVAQYSARALTFPHDKLPAIAGVAAKFAAASRSAYVAGMWGQNLALDLLWAVGPSGGRPPWHHPAPVEYRAPTFSWASVEGTIAYDDPQADPALPLKSSIAVIDIDTRPATENTLGQLLDCAVVLCGLVIEGVLALRLDESSPLSSPYALRIRGSPTVEVHVDTALVLDEEGGGPRRATELLALPELGSASPPSTVSGPVLCLPVAAAGHQYVSGLVLGRSGRVDGAYERLGMFACAHEWFEGAEKRKIKLV